MPGDGQEIKDPVARAMMESHIVECREDRREMREMHAAAKADMDRHAKEVWNAIDGLRGWWFRLGAWLVTRP